MRSNSAKPPPPVPPRPSKTLVAEALAKTRGAIEKNCGFLPVAPHQVQRSVSGVQKERPVIFHSKKLEEKQPVKTDDHLSINRENGEKNHVNSLIDEMFASILDGECDQNSELLLGAFNQNVNKPPKHDDSPAENNCETPSHSDVKISNESLDNFDGKKFDDKRNHEFLISELEKMHQSERKSNRKKRPPPLDLSGEKIQRSDWVEVNTNGQEVRLSRCEIIIEDRVDNEIASRLNEMSSYGLPPLPKSLSGFSLKPQTPPNSAGFGPLVHPRLSNGGSTESPGRAPTNLDNQLAILRREMFSLRQLDLSLLSQLWSLNESIQEFRQMLQDQDDRGLSPPSPSPSPSSCDDGETDEFFSPSPMKLRPAPPPPPLRRTSNSSSANSSEYGTV